MNTFKLFIIILFIIPLSGIAQQDFANNEDKVLFAGINKSELSVKITPIINWPINTELQDKVFVSKFELSQKVENTSVLVSKMESLISANIINQNDKSFLLIETTFQPQNAKMLAMVLYSLGIANILLDGNAISIYQYPDTYKAVAMRGLQNNRTYLK